MADTAEIVNFYSFLQTQDYTGKIGLDAVKTARTREELGITSLGVIMLVANYMEARDVSNAEFSPDWVTKLESVDGIVSVFREIDSRTRNG